MPEFSPALLQHARTPDAGLRGDRAVSADSPLTGEVFNEKVAAIFAGVQQAEQAAERVRVALDLPPAQVQVVRPGEYRPGHKLEPESHGIFRTLVIAHARLGIAGAVAGAALFGLLLWLAVPWVANSPWLAFAVFTGFGATAGLMLGGLVTLRPDHDLYLLAVQEALRAGRSAVIVHARSVEEQRRAEAALQQEGGETVRTL